MSLTYKEVLIVGANRGIGLGLVIEVLKVSSTATVYATARDLEKATKLQELVKEYGKRLVLLKADMNDEAGLAQTVAELKKHTSTLDLAIFNAGVELGRGRIEDLKTSVLIDQFVSNTAGPHTLVKCFYPFLLASKAEKRMIVLMSSIAGTIGGLADITPVFKEVYRVPYIPLGAYSVSKAALSMLGRQWAELLEPQGVAVWSLHPGGVSTDMNIEVGMMSVSDASQQMIQALEKAELKDAGNGILQWDGTMLPW